MKAAKRALKFCMADHRLSGSEFSSVCARVANLLNERPLGTLPSVDSEINILTPNCLLLGRSFASNPGGWAQPGSLKSRVRLVDSIGKNFWVKWCELYAPTLYHDRPQVKGARNFKPGDIVVVTDPKSLKPEYFIAKVKETFPSCDGIIRKVSVAYKNFKVGEQSHEYSGAKDRVLLRSVH